MDKLDQNRIKELLERIARISSAEEWEEDMNPSQWTALSYLVRANKFSRSPSQVADFMSATRGTVSQTLKVLARKGFIEEIRSIQDKRSISYNVTNKGRALFQKQNSIDDALASFDDNDGKLLLDHLEKLVRTSLKLRGLRAFGICKKCRYHKKVTKGGFCNLLNEPLSEDETKQICHEYSEVA